jgi:CxxC-x17-CxxC domain-containing protein
MFEATCDKCGSKCSVPFQPTSGKPIFCSKCFEEKNSRNSRPAENYKEQFVTLNHKLDKILRILEPVIAKDEVVEITKPAKKTKSKKTSPVKTKKAEK